MNTTLQINAAKLRAARVAAGFIDASALARATSYGMAPATYRTWERDKRPPITRFEHNVIVDVARVLGVTPE